MLLGYSNQGHEVLMMLGCTQQQHICNAADLQQVVNRFPLLPACSKCRSSLQQTLLVWQNIVYAACLQQACMFLHAIMQAGACNHDFYRVVSFKINII